MNYAIDSLMNGDAVSFKDQIRDMLAGKLSDRLEAEKASVAETLFADPVVAEEDDSDYEEEDGDYSEDDELEEGSV